MPVEYRIQNTLEFTVQASHDGQRLDLFLASCCEGLIPGSSRSMLQNLVRKGLVVVDDKKRKTGYRLRSGEQICLRVPAPEPVALVPEPVPFEVLFEDDDIIVISKPPGVVVHPACGHKTGTLVHGLLYHCADLSGINGTVRPGIVHRLDKDTSGVMIAAKHDAAHQALVAQFKAKTVKKIYLALIDGRARPPEGCLRTLIGRHPVHRRKMAVRSTVGREAVTDWRTLRVFQGHLSLLEVRISTGRTHQIRVHMAYQGTPVAGDTLYGHKKASFTSLGITRQMLHARHISFIHPLNGAQLAFTAALWPDMASVIEGLGGWENNDEYS
ncbi:RluA family pseudouridine synthase [Desulfobacterota bacterium M19]